MADPRLIIRQARRADKKSLIDLCRRSVRGDYVPMFMDEFLSEGGLFIATRGEMAVGMVKYTRCLGGDGWLGAARTDPKHRRQGIASALIEACFQHAAIEKAKNVRLWSNRGNKAAQAAIRSMGFREIGMFKRVTRRVRKPTAEFGLTAVSNPGSVMSLIGKSEILGQSKGYAALVNEFMKVDERVISDACRKGNLLRYEDNICLVESNPWYGKWRVLEFFPLAGDVSTIIDQVNVLARRVRRGTIHTYVPVNSKMARTAYAKGFKVVHWGEDAVLFERRVR